MSDATYGGDATSTSREGLQQVRLARSLPKKLGGSSACHSGRPAFCDNHTSPPSITNHRSPGRSFVFVRFDLRYPSALGGAAIRTCVLEMRAGWRCDSPSPVLRRIGVVVCAARAGHVVAAFGRHSSRPKCGGRRDGCPANRRPRGATVGGPPFSRREAEFVSEFETKRDQ